MSKAYLVGVLSVMVAFTGCSEDPHGLARAGSAATTVKMDFFAKPLAEIPLPNDIATRWDPDSPTGRRLNASMVAPTVFESHTRQLINDMDGWGVFQPITIPFTGPLDVLGIREAHDDPDYATADDVIYLVDIDPDSPDFGDIHHLDVGNGNYPLSLERGDLYEPHDPRGWTISLLFEEADEDVNGNGRLDRGEDTDADGVLDRPNYLPGMTPERDDLGGRADALMTFYERQTNTLIVRPMVPLRERTTYAVVVTRRMQDVDGQAVGSPYPGINHNAHTAALEPLAGILRRDSEAFGGLGLADVAFAWTFTTQSVTSQLMIARDGLYGHGPQGHLSEEYPARINEFFRLHDNDNVLNPYILQTEFIAPILTQLAPALGDAGDSQRQTTALIESHQYIDFHVIGSFDSPQLFEREDENGVPLPFNDQAWPATLDTEPVEARSETVYFWLAVPRPEVSARGNGEPAPLIVYSHGYTSNHFDALAFAGFFAQHGVATLAIDNVSHGIAIDDEDVETYTQLASLVNLEAFLNAVNHGRAFDQNNDGKADSGADFYGAYVFHTRDMLRQGVLDYMNLVRLASTFDGERRWEFDLDGDGENELAGDFDGDGVLDIGGDASMCGLGISLGSIVASVLGGVEPRLDCIAAVLPGGGITDISVRSLQGGVPEAFALRVMGPLYYGAVAEDGSLPLTSVVPTGNDAWRRQTVTIAGPVRTGDTIVLENLVNGERDCGYVAPDGGLRVAVESDTGDAHVISHYSGEALVLGSEHCDVIRSARLAETIDTFGHEVEYEGTVHMAGDELVAITDGLGIPRASPDFRRLLTLAQAVMDPADPAVYGRHLLDEPVSYASTGEVGGTSVMSLAMVGDMSVPTASAAALARSQGLLPFLEVDPRYGMPANQVLLDSYAIEGVDLLGRHEYGVAGEYPNGVHIDIENFSDGQDIWGSNVPRLDPPLRLHGDDSNGRQSGFFFAYARPEGEHGFPLPLELEGQLRSECADACEDDDCGCDEITTFDPAFFYFNLIGEYLGSGGTRIPLEACMSSNDCRCEDGAGDECVGWPPPPELRSTRDFLR